MKKNSFLKNKFTVSVIIPNWNRAELLRKAIQSVLNQTYAPLEILVSDDGSTDDSYQVVKSFRNAKIKWLSADHLGLPAVVRNRAINKSKGEWLAFLDSDDNWKPEKLEKQISLMKKMGALAVCGNAFSIQTNGDKERYLDYQKNTICFDDLLDVNYVILSSMLFHKSLINRCKGLPESPIFKTGPDYVLWLRFATQTDIYYQKDILVNYLANSPNSIRKATKNIYLQRVYTFQNLLFWCITNNISSRYILKSFHYYIKSILFYFKNSIKVMIKTR